MKKLIICLFAVVISFTSYAQPLKTDTTYFRHKNINYRKTSTIYVGGGIRYTIKNIDAKYNGDMKTRSNYSREAKHQKELQDYYSNLSKTITTKLNDLFVRYVKENFTTIEKRKLLNFAKNTRARYLFGFAPWLEKDASFVEAHWELTDKPNILSVLTDEDIADLDVFMRKNLIIEKSGLASQYALAGRFVITTKNVIEFLEQDLQGK